MAIDTDLISRRFLDGVKIVVVHPLTVVVLASWNDVSNITALHGIVAIVYHELVGLVQVTLIIANRSGGLVVHHQTDAFAVRIIIEHFHVEIRIGRYEIKYIIFRLAEPIFPAFVPTFYQDLVKSVLGGKIDVFLHVLVVRSMATVGLGLGIVCLAQLDGRQVVGICPCAFVGDHFPPDTDIFYRFDPGDIFQYARLIQVKGNAGSQYISSVVTDDHRTPWRNARSLQVSFITLGIRCQPRLEDEVLVIQVQVHARVIH